jgi:hypothetical protein
MEKNQEKSKAGENFDPPRFSVEKNPVIRYK